ncbi:hypothetical protein PoB_000734000 [Plakobranchus ocellatus]|uniref:Uncharacterized protein n=1 Tax=Plakobranchus ocellatus TaxID=259542 RepID=A0AAV3YDQ2_9GAST|nr:hypothetical protein PoB_000734000 [Plakobranchus ocellatus]
MSCRNVCLQSTAAIALGEKRKSQSSALKVSERQYVLAMICNHGMYLTKSIENEINERETVGLLGQTWCQNIDENKAVSGLVRMVEALGSIRYQGKFANVMNYS